MMNALFLPCLVLALFLSASLASPVVVSESASAAAANPASASPAVLNSASKLSPAVPNSELSSSVGLLPLPIPIAAPNPISLALYEDFVLYTKYSSAAYQPFCARPVGRVLVRAFEIGHTQGFIARDPARLEIVVVFRGTFSLKDAVTDAKFLLVPFESPGIVELVHVHRGFLGAYQNVSDQVVGIVAKELKEYPEFRVVVTGHSLGGAIASLAAPSIKAALPDAVVKLYTFGQPRAGNAKFARYVERMVGAENIHRAVHTLDGVPTMVPRIFGYEHFATEYWQFRDPLPGPFALVAPHETVTKCEGNEDKKCSVQFPSGGINPFHTFYFGQVMAVNPLLCR